jgi:hypothetical protein
MKQTSTILGIILVCGYCVILMVTPARLDRQRRAMSEIKAQAEAKLKSAIQIGEQALQPFVEELAP